MLQGNGTLGTMIWGEGRTLNITVGRADLWDHRGGLPWTDKMSYKNIRTCLEKSDIVVFLVDDMGIGDIGCYGSTFHETPNIDRLCAEGVRFAQAYAACTVCSPSRAALLTGRYPGRLHLTDWIAGHDHPHAKLRVPDWKMCIDHERVTLPKALNPSFLNAHLKMVKMGHI